MEGRPNSSLNPKPYQEKSLIFNIKEASFLFRKSLTSKTLKTNAILSVNYIG